MRKLRSGGAKVNESCGIHVHVDAAAHTARTLRNIANIIAAKEDILYKALKVRPNRESYCQKVDEAFLERLNRGRPSAMTMDTLEKLWYNGRGDRYHHYDRSRYHGLNLHSVFYKGTVEFRLFNSTLHAGEVKTYIQLCLAISHQALTQKNASHTRTRSANEKYTFRTWLLRLGLIGPEFKTARFHLLKHLDGNIAWLDPEKAARAKREAALRSDNAEEGREEQPALLAGEERETEEEEGASFTLNL